MGALLPAITIAFSNDRDLLDIYHISPGTLEHCAKHTYDSITPWGDKLVYYKVVLRICDDNNDVSFVDIGFVVITVDPVNILISFGINIKYRQPGILFIWMKKIKSLFRPKDGITYVVSLHAKNVRTINFFRKNGFQLSVNSDQTVSLWQ